MGFDFRGKNGNRINLGYSHANALSAVLSEILRRPIEIGIAPEAECKAWAAALRENIGRLRFIKTRRASFLVIQGANIKRMFSEGPYKHDVIDFEPSWEAAEALDEDWRDLVLEFASFLDSSGGIVEFG